MFKKLPIALVFSAFYLISNGQNQIVDTAEVPVWIDMMQDPKANFFETQRAFNLYWENRTIEKGCGWKPFKRWEAFTEIRVDENGNLPAPDHNLNEYIKFYQSKQKSYSVNAQGNWKEIGPINLPANGTGQPNGLGRVNCLAFHPLQANTWFVGAPSGGVWRTYNAGVDWETTTDSLPTLGVSSILFNHSNANTILIGTGDRDGSDAPGIGVMISNDGGDTWYKSNTGMGNKVVGRLLMHPSDSNIILAATSGGIYKSVNGGVNWIRKSSNTQHYKDMTFKPNDPNIVYATEGGNFYRSINNGDTWTAISSGFSGNITRMAIGVSIDDPNVVYVLAVDNKVFEGLYRSTDSGLNFTLRSSTPNIMDYSTDGSGTGGQGWYDLCIAVDPSDINNIYSGGVNIFKSTDGGLSWTINAHWTGSGGAAAIHADQHELIYSPLNGKLFSGNDGGIYSTINGGLTWVDHSEGLAIAQVYKIGQSTLSSKLCINGYQDNGTSVYDGSWRTEIGGDGMECIVDYSDTNYMYGALYYGDVRRSTNNGINFSRIARDGKNGINESGAWITPYILDVIDPATMYIGYKNLWRSTNIKTASSNSVNWTKITSGLAGVNNSTIRVLEQSEKDPDLLYMARYDNKFFRTENLSSSSPIFTDLTSNLPVSTWPRDIEANPTNVNELWIVMSSRVWHSNNKGVSWTNISSNLPNISVNCIVYDQSTDGDLYVGTDLGVYVLPKGETNWLDFNSDLPISVEVTELEIYYANDRKDSRLKAATYGRGLWESELFEKPTADFSAPAQVVCINQAVKFTDKSTGSYNSLLWTFNGAIPSTSTKQHPTVVFPNVGTYDVTLSVYNDLNGDTITKTSYITASPSQINVEPDTAFINFGNSITLTANGSTSYSWFPSFGLNQNSGSVVVATPVVSTTYYVYGDNGGTCDTAQSVIFVRPVGIDEVYETNNVSIYPNPTNGVINIHFEERIESNFEVLIFDLSGKKLINKYFEAVNDEDVQIEVDHLSKGIYMLQIVGESDSPVFRMVIE